MVSVSTKDADTAKPEDRLTPKTWEEREVEMGDDLIDALKKRARIPRAGSILPPVASGRRTFTKSSKEWQGQLKSGIRARISFARPS